MKQFAKIVHSMAFIMVTTILTAVSLVVAWMFAACQMVLAYEVSIISFVVFFALSFLPVAVEE